MALYDSAFDLFETMAEAGMSDGHRGIKMTAANAQDIVVLMELGLISRTGDDNRFKLTDRGRSVVADRDKTDHELTAEANDVLRRLKERKT